MTSTGQPRRVSYLDSSAIVKLAVAEPESSALRTYLKRRPVCVSSALACTEVLRALLALGPDATRRGQQVLQAISLIRISDRVLRVAGALAPAELRSLDAIHLATAQLVGPSLTRMITYDERLGAAATAAGYTVVAPA